MAGNGKELLTARLRKPEGFRGTPIFADDRGVAGKDPMQELVENDPACQIAPDPGDTTGRVFILRVTDFSQCGVLKRNVRNIFHCVVKRADVRVKCSP